jgi:hypothetical protein
MAIWRQPELEALLGGPLDAEGLTQEAIERLVDEGARESEVLDFKGALESPPKGPRPTWLPEQEFAKDVAAFANHRGGLLLVGVEDVGGIATKSAGWALPTNSEAEERRLRQALVNYLSGSHTVTSFGSSALRVAAFLALSSHRAPVLHTQ